EAEWAREIDLLLGGGPPSSGPCYDLYRQKTAARFAPGFEEEDLARMKTSWSTFIAAYRRTVPPRRRILAGIAAPVAWFLPSSLSPRAAQSVSI
ncbi:MAG: hypothetical protein LBB83_00105, partial [Treponema sp.]|nr:hypothetical protein [Treponema sp.]